MNSRARGWPSRWLALRSPLWTILLPSVFAGYVPWKFFGLGENSILSYKEDVFRVFFKDALERGGVLSHTI